MNIITLKKKKSFNAFDGLLFLSHINHLLFFQCKKLFYIVYHKLFTTSDKTES